jgi:hypothetical protein
MGLGDDKSPLHHFPSPEGRQKDEKQKEKKRQGDQAVFSISRPGPTPKSADLAVLCCAALRFAAQQH